MRRIAVIFLVAVFVPSLVLGLLALRTASEQRVVLERQTSELYKKDADQLAGQLAGAVLGRQQEFANRVRVLLSSMKPRHLASDFGGALGERQPGVAFVVAPDGGVVTTQARSREDFRFLRENDAFLSNRASEELFPTQQNLDLSEDLRQGSNSGVVLNNTNATASQTPGGTIISLNPRAGLNSSLYTSNATANNTTATNALATSVENNAAMNSTIRTLQPEKNIDLPEGQDPRISKAAFQISGFQTAIAGGTDGVLARFTQNELELILWTRPPEAGGYIFGLAMPAKAVRALVRKTFATLQPKSNDACLAVLDEDGNPVGLSVPGFNGNWKSPFVSTEIGETLPHWEAAVYLLQPDQLVHSARLVTLTIVMLITLALAAILVGGCLVALDTRRQLALAQKKTDFVSNVSHELKTPLTSIRMFAELLEQGRVAEPEKRARYLRIITLESERLTRLINNVLDFARSEKKQSPYLKKEIDLYPVIDRAWEAQSIHLRDAGFVCEWIAEDSPYPVMADADSIGQVLVNLLSNAEKYSGDRREITLHTSRQAGELRVSVLDRGIGVPSGDERKIFEAFHRANDSLAGNVQGSGLGLTLASRIARDHGGSVDYEKREGGGSIFTLRVPLANPEAKT